MNDRERFVKCVLGEPVDRPPYLLMWGPWGGTWRRWQQEGKPEDADHRSPFGPDNGPHGLPVNCGPCPKFEYKVLEETDDYVVHTDSWGIVRRDYKHGESMAGFLEFPVKTRADWERYREERLNPDDPERLAGDWRESARKWHEQGIPIQLGYFPDVGVFGSVRWLLGDEEGLIAFHTMPDLVHDIMDHMTSLYLTVFEKVARELKSMGVGIDVIHIWEDMCYRNGPLISPEHWVEFMGPHYRRVKTFMGEYGIPVLSVDTDGNPDLIAQPMIDAGVNLLFPMEVAAGCDVNVWRKKYPSLALLGGIDKRALAQGPEAIDRELERIRPAVEGGMYVPDLDHLIPDDVSWENYCYYARALKKLIGKE
jgi:hypothetical protein